MQPAMGGIPGSYVKAIESATVLQRAILNILNKFSSIQASCRGVLPSVYRNWPYTSNLELRESPAIEILGEGWCAPNSKCKANCGIEFFPALLSLKVQLPLTFKIRGSGLWQSA